jgi:hypothetical protein
MRTPPLALRAIGLAAIFFLIASGENWSSPIGPMMPQSLRAGVK